MTERPRVRAQRREGAQILFKLECPMCVRFVFGQCQSHVRFPPTKRRTSWHFGFGPIGYIPAGFNSLTIDTPDSPGDNHARRRGHPFIYFVAALCRRRRDVRRGPARDQHRNPITCRGNRQRGGTPPGLRSSIAVTGLQLALTNIEMLADLHRTEFRVAARASGRRAPACRIWSGRQRST